MKKDDTVYLRHILECVHRIEEDIAEGRERFMAAHTLQNAILRNLQVMAESTQRLSDVVKGTQPDGRVAQDCCVPQHLGARLPWD
jgi:uncharacterized protein with HEPN domain